MKNKIYASDLSIINALFFPENKAFVIYDPHGQIRETELEKHKIFNKPTALEDFCKSTSSDFVLVNISNQKPIDYFNYSKIIGCIDFCKSNVKNATPYFFINNPDQSMRWIFPKKSTSACFLNLYNGSGLKSFAFKEVVKKLSRVGWLHPIVSGEFSVFSKNKKTIEPNFGEIKYDDFAIFTGTVGADRKAVIALSSKNKCTHFVKVPLTETARKLTETEFSQLSKLSSISFQNLEIPTTHKTPKGIVVSNVQPAKVEKNTLFQSLHLQSLEELYHHSAEINNITSISSWKTIREGIDFLRKVESTENGLSVEVIQKLRLLCEEIFYNIKDTDQINTAIGHGDFTPWNMYLSDSKLHLYDWEMSEMDTPILFDVFHFFFQKGILIDRKSATAIFKEIQEAMESPLGQQIITSFSLDWEKHYQLYLLYIVCKYLPKYSTQVRLHEQVHWLTSCWLDALKDTFKLAERN